MMQKGSKFAPDTDEENDAKPAVYVPQLNIKHVQQILEAIAEFFESGGNCVSKYAHLFEDYRPLDEHIADALAGKQ